ncbi:hypothetical protein [Algibacter luteus]|uniref:hypothetical protein n=1 Tax=Algibacter luteus TaxID=1178825 RepID=UPI0025967534|nr:hypothetical protein [Algibacter luteus]WJJ96549.1 hypothetical protein O5O44_15150 [Algibacter luteus]
MERIKINDKTIVVVNNEWVLINPTEFIAGQKNNKSIKVIEKPLSEINYESNFEKIIGLNNVAEFNPELGIDYAFVKSIDPKKKIFYMVDGIPSHNFNFVGNYLISRKIKEINNIGINQAIAIWGKREGENGAIQIKTFDKDDVVIPIIIK